MRLFVYGTLKYAEIMRALCGQSFPYTSATLHDYRVISLRDKPYPGLIHADGYTARGKFVEIEQNVFELLSIWEDEEYSATEITVLVNDTKLSATAFVHVAKDEQLPEEWIEANFKSNHLEDYVLNRIPRFLKQLNNQ